MDILMPSLKAVLHLPHHHGSCKPIDEYPNALSGSCRCGLRLVFPLPMGPRHKYKIQVCVCVVCVSGGGRGSVLFLVGHVQVYCVLSTLGMFGVRVILSLLAKSLLE